MIRIAGTTAPALDARAIKAIIRELEAVTAKLAAQRVTGPARLGLLRRQAELGDRRDALLAARRKAAAVQGR